MAPLTDSEKAAYRELLYQAMLDIRQLCQSRGDPSDDPVEWRDQYPKAREAGALADWLHNLAHDSASDFVRFDPDKFWNAYEYLCARYDRFGTRLRFDYRRRFEERVRPSGAT